MAERSGRAEFMAILIGVVLLAAGCQDQDSRPAPSGDAGSEPLAETPSSHDEDGSSSSPQASSPATPPLLLPDLRSLPAEDVHVRSTDDGLELRFAAILANAGAGPLLLVPEEDPLCPEGERHASQIVYRDVDRDGRFGVGTDTERELFPAGCMVFHRDHDHWHFDASASYVLTRPGEQTPVVATEKVSFCMRDSRHLPGERWADAPETFGECERDDVQGITAGWGDVYDADLPGQALPLPADLADGVYCLRLTADPFGLLRENDEDNNSSVVAVELSGAAATREPGADVCTS